MFGSNSFSWFKSSSRDSSQYPTWDANSVTMQQPSSPFPPTTQNVVTEQPVLFYVLPHLRRLDSLTQDRPVRRT